MNQAAATPQALHPRCFAWSNILDVQASAPAVRSVAKRPAYLAWHRLVTVRS